MWLKVLLMFKVPTSDVGNYYSPKVSVSVPALEGKCKGTVASVLLTKHHSMKVYWVSGDTAPHILDLGTRWR
jgi:hypothetical protein